MKLSTIEYDLATKCKASVSYYRLAIKITTQTNKISTGFWGLNEIKFHDRINNRLVTAVEHRLSAIDRIFRWIANKLATDGNYFFIHSIDTRTTYYSIVWSNETVSKIEIVFVHVVLAFSICQVNFQSFTYYRTNITKTQIKKPRTSAFNLIINNNYIQVYVHVSENKQK